MTEFQTGFVIGVLMMLIVHIITTKLFMSRVKKQQQEFQEFFTKFADDDCD